jgi:hypothetical protein
VWGRTPAELDEANARLLRDGTAVALAPTPFAVLCALARQPGSLLTTNALLDEVWGHQFVTDSVLRTAISELRTALDDDARKPRFMAGAERLAASTVPARLRGCVFVLQTIKHLVGWNSRAAFDPRLNRVFHFRHFRVFPLLMMVHNQPPKNSCCQVRDQWPAILAVVFVISAQLLPQAIDRETYGLEIRRSSTISSCVQNKNGATWTPSCCISATCWLQLWGRC